MMVYHGRIEKELCLTGGLFKFLSLYCVQTEWNGMAWHAMERYSPTPSVPFFHHHHHDTKKIVKPLRCDAMND